jgi:hypothetical protein
MSLSWLTGHHGVYVFRDGAYDEGPLGDNWSYIDINTLCIVDYRPEGNGGEPRDEPVVLAGPFPTLDVAKAAYLVMYGSVSHGG